MIFLLWTAVFLVTLIVYLRRVYNKFSSYGVKNPPIIPLLGNMYGFITKQKHMVDEFHELYSEYPGERFVGKYEFLTPIIVANDIELIKTIALKDFDSFIDRRRVTDEKNDPMVGRNLFFIRGREWKDMRSTLSPAFTSSKIKQMVPFMVEEGNQMLKTLEKKIKDSGGSLNVDAKDLCTRYATDVIATCAFGVKVDSHTDKNNTFYVLGRKMATLGTKQLFLFLFYESFPNIVKWLKITFITDAARKFFTDLVTNTMSNREAKNIVRPDMIHLLMEAKKGQLTYDKLSEDNILTSSSMPIGEEISVGNKTQLKVWSNDDLIAQAVVFLIAGFETISTAMSFTLYELAKHPEMQDRLVKEIKELDAKNNGKIDYTSIQNMTYMDMVVSEVLRLWPPVPFMDRICVKDYNLGKPNDKATQDYIVRKGDNVSVPVWAIHRDPKFYPNPEKFDPERFSEENKHLINPYTYMPFGLGPRNCIGSRFALCELKVFLYQTLLRLEVFPSVLLRTPIALVKDSINMTIVGGHWVEFKIRR